MRRQDCAAYAAEPLRSGGAAEVQCHGFTDGLRDFFFLSRSKQTKTNTQTNTQQTNNTDTAHNTHTHNTHTHTHTTHHTPTHTGAAAGLSQSAEADQPSMLCDDWVTPNRLERLVPEHTHTHPRPDPTTAPDTTPQQQQTAP